MKNQGQGVEVHGLTSDRLKEKELSTDSFDEGGDDNDDHEGSLSESSGTTGTGQQSKAEKEEHAVQFARKETEQICWLRGTVSIVMLLATFMVSVVIFYSTRKSQIEQFNSEFEDHATILSNAFGSHLRAGVVAMDNLAVSLTALGINSAFQWPFATEPQWDVHASSASNSAAADFLAYAPYVEDRQRQAWENFALQFKDWTNETSYGQDKRSRELQDVDFSQGIASEIYQFSESGIPEVAPPDSGPYFPIWQNYEVNTEVVNFNILSHWSFGPEVEAASNSKAITIGMISEWTISHPAPSAEVDLTANPHSHLYFPIFGDFDSSVLVAMVIISVNWANYLTVGDVQGTNAGVIIVLTNECGQSYTYEWKGNVTFLGEGDLHDEEFDDMEQIFSVSGILTEKFLAALSYTEIKYNDQFCALSVRFYPSEEFEQDFITNEPVYYTLLVVVVFLVTTCAFVGYDYLVERRQRVVLNKAVKSHQIVASLFPAVVRKRLFGEGDDNDDDQQSVGSSVARPQTGKMRIRNFLDTGDTHDNRDASGNGTSLVSSSKPIADLFPQTTVLFADIAGFTAWSSVREPAQVFTLLETLYAAFDKIALKRKVFKVETIGDCYVAVTGLPVPQENHAVIMARFAAECMTKMDQLAQALVPDLGPDTAELCIRVGLHSGAVTAGVLRGQKSRFQLFGDTVNTASRMESNGLPRKIQCSQATADLLVEANKSNWLTARDDKVIAKGKGEVTTFWVSPRTGSHSGPSSSRSGSDNESVASSEMDTDAEHSGDESNPVPKKTPSSKSAKNEQLQRLVQWNFDLLARQIRVIMAKRASQSGSSRSKETSEPPIFHPESLHPRDEYSKVIALPRFDARTAVQQVDPNDINLTENVKRQLLDYVTRIGLAYHANPFHNFEHATHVAMSANKILSNIIVAEDCEVPEEGANPRQIFEELHKFTFGINSDPLTHFAALFSALIHDVDHAGVANGVLIAEKDELAIMYEGKSVLEQNSIDLAWEMLMEPSYADLRSCLFPTEEDIRRFRKLVVNSVMATDIFDPELKALRNSRWEEAFHTDGGDKSEVFDLKATIVIEHIIQAADVAHTMQHWHVYQKWNKRLFQEMYKAYKFGRNANDPSEGWYKGELWFFDNYVIPLAKKLDDCGVFGTSSDEFLQYATNNRAEWMAKGESIVEEMLAEVKNN